jgi:glycerophosphoryl diester phosphodiesterase
MAYRGFAGGGYVGHHLSVALLEGLRPAADHAGRHATIESVLGTAARYISDGISWRAVVTLDSTGTSLVDGAGNTGLYLNTLAPSIIAHRGAGGIYAPDNAMSSYLLSKNVGMKNIEQDVWLLADGSLGCMHDSTADRTTTGTGSIAALTGAQFTALTLDSSAVLGGAWQDEPAPLFDDVLRRMGNSGAVLWPEAKNAGAAAGIVSALLRYNIPKDKAVLQSFSYPDLAYARGAGYAAAFLADPAGVNWTTLAADGIAYVVWPAWTLALTATARGYGITPITYTLNRRRDVALAQAMGVGLVFSDDPLWAGGVTSPAKRDMFAAKMWQPGMIGSTYLVADRGKFLSSNSFGWDDENVLTYQGCMQGWACPIGGNDNANSFTISYDQAIDAIANTERWGSVFICSNTDAVFNDSADDASSGYHVLVRASGMVQIFKRVAGQAAVSMDYVSGSALALGTFYSVVITVTPTTISVSIPSLSRSVTVTDSDFRGGYFHLGRHGSAVRFKNVVIS